METDRDKLSPGGEFLSNLATNLKDRLKIRNDIWHISSLQPNGTTEYAVKSELTINSLLLEPLL